MTKLSIIAAIVHTAMLHGVDPYLALSVVKEENELNPTAVGGEGEIRSDK